jgi:hypothetical protein
MSLITQDMEAQQNDEHMTLMNFSFERHGLEFNYLRAFEFDDDFNQPDAGQIQNQPTALDEKDLLIRLRDITKRDSLLIPPTIYAFYDNCKKHFVEEFMSLLTGLLSNIEKAKKLRDRNADDHLLDFFNIQLGSHLNFGKHQTFMDSAAECEAEVKAKLRACGKEIQIMVQTGREKAITAARTKLQACSEDFKTFGENEWKTQCKKTSLHNILDQHFAVKCLPIDKDAMSESDEFVEDSAPFKLWKASTWLYNAAIHDSKKEIDKDIRFRRSQKLKSQAEAAALRARRAAVDIRADAAKPEVTLGDHLRRLDLRLEESYSLIQGISQAQAETSNTADTSQKTKDQDPDLVHKLERKVLQLDRRLHALQMSAPPDTSKNDMRAESAETQQSAGKNRRRRTKRPRAEEADATTAEPDSPTPMMQHMTGRQHPRPPAPNHARGNERKANQHQRGRHHGHQRQIPDQDLTDDDAPHLPDARKRHDYELPQPTSSRSRRGQGRGRGQGRE